MLLENVICNLHGVNKIMFYSKRIMPKYLEVTFHDVYKCA